MKRSAFWLAPVCSAILCSGAARAETRVGAGIHYGRTVDTLKEFSSLGRDVRSDTVTLGASVRLSF